MKPARLIPLFALALASCQQSKEGAPESNPEAKPGFVISDGRLVLPAVKGNPGAAYFDLTDSGDLAGVVVGVHIDGTGKAEMHETKGAAMAPLDALEIRPGETVHFAPGGKHVMAFDLADSLNEGSTTEMTVTFSDGDKVSVPLKVEAAGGGQMDAMDGMDHGEGH